MKNLVIVLLLSFLLSPPAMAQVTEEGLEKNRACAIRAQSLISNFESEIQADFKNWEMCDKEQDCTIYLRLLRLVIQKMYKRPMTILKTAKFTACSNCLAS